MTITRMRNGKLEYFHENAYKESPRVLKIKDNLVNNFGYGKIEAREIAREVVANLDRYLALENLRLRKAIEASDNRTLLAKPKTILELRAEAKRGNV